MRRPQGILQGALGRGDGLGGLAGLGDVGLGAGDLALEASDLALLLLVGGKGREGCRFFRRDSGRGCGLWEVKVQAADGRRDM